MKHVDMLHHWSWTAPVEAIMLDDGLINSTWRLDGPSGPVAVLQRLNTSIFRASVHEDIAGITAQLDRAGVGVPRLLPTTTGELWVDEGEEVWRCLSHVGSHTIHRVHDLAEAIDAATLVARFHGALADFEWDFHHIRPGAHDTDKHMATLRQALAEHGDHRLYDPTAQLAERIFATWDAVRPLVPTDLPTRIIHGDLKISNLRFDGGRAVALVDLDTMAHGTLDVELGDAMRSWCASASENAREVGFDVDIFGAAMTGYAAGTAEWGPTEDEWQAILPGIRRISIELAARFAADALHESYFGWDAANFPAAGEHNLLRAQGQASMSASVAHAQSDAEQRLRQARR